MATLFLANGALFANLVPRFPEIKNELVLSDGAFGLSVAAFSAGALLSGLAAGRLIRRFGSAGVAVYTSLGLAVCIVLAGAATTPTLFAVALFLAGCADAVTDVAQNAQGLVVQRRYGRSIINSLHATWSVGAITGGVIAGAGIALDIPRTSQLIGTGAVFAVLCLLGRRHLLPAESGGDLARNDAGSGRQPDAPARSRRRWLLSGLALLAVAGAVVEDAGSSWATLYLGRDLGAAADLAAAGFIAMVAFQFLGRLLGDRLVERFSPRSVVRAGGVLIATAMGVALIFPSVPMTIAGFALAGFGVATVAPAAFHAADAVPGLRPGTGLTAVTWFMRIGFLLSPVLVGAVADAVSLRVALLTVVIAGVLIAVLAAGILPGRRRTPS